VPEWILKKQILLQSIVYYEIGYRIIREFNLKTHSAFLDHVEHFDRVIREKLFEILQSKNIPNYLLKRITEIYCGTKIKEKLKKISYQKKRTINHEVRQVCPLSPTPFDNCMNEIILKWNQIYTKGIT